MSDITANVDHVRQASHRARTRQAAELPSLGGCALMRALSFPIGVSLLATSVGIWAFASADAAAMLIKFGASIAFLGGAAVFLLMAVAPQDTYHLEFDAKAQVFRVLEKDEMGRFYVQETHRLKDIEKLRFEAGALRAWDADGVTVMAVPMQARFARKIINAVLAIA